jgi:hypothetical protein
MFEGKAAATGPIKTTSLRIPEATWSTLRHTCLDRQVSMTAAILAGVELWLAGVNTGMPAATNCDTMRAKESPHSPEEQRYIRLLLSLIGGGHESTLGNAVIGLLEVHGAHADKGHPNIQPKAVNGG